MVPDEAYRRMTGTRIRRENPDWTEFMEQENRKAK